MKITTSLDRKEPQMELTECMVSEIVELPLKQYTHFKNRLLDEYDFIANHTAERYNDFDNRDCILVLCGGEDDGILVDSQGSAYARYSAPIPRARTIVNAHLDKITRYCVGEGTSHTTDGKWTISNDEIFLSFRYGCFPKQRLA